MRKTPPWIIAGLFLWLLIWIWRSWPGVQDDALIHLRYADYLHRLHRITYDGVHQSYGTSSLLYVTILAYLRGFTTSALLPRAFSTSIHLLLFALIATYSLLISKDISRRTQLILLALLLALTSPSAVRWLNDGMETGLELLLVSLLVVCVHRVSLRVTPEWTDTVALALLGAGSMLLRVELVSVVGLCCLLLLLSSKYKHGERAIDLLKSITPLVLGASAAALTIVLKMHSLLPDTALAKSHGISAFTGTLRGTAIVLAGSLTFGLGLMCLWLLTGALLWKVDAPRRSLTLAANSLFPIVLLAAALRGQEIQGVRYFAWCFFFSVCWNILELVRIDSANRPGKLSNNRAFLSFTVLLSLAVVLESFAMQRVLRDRVQTMDAFLSADLAPLSNQLGIAGDIGFISYFSRAPICDLAGLVNGRAAAALSVQQRYARCAQKDPSFAFVNAGQAQTLTKYLDFSSWKICGKYNFGNFRIPDAHFLLVKPELAASVCSANHFSPEPASLALIETSY